jgi:hypothetical protein
MLRNVKGEKIRSKLILIFSSKMLGEERTNCNRVDAKELHEIRGYDEKRVSNRYATKPGKTRGFTKKN